MEDFTASVRALAWWRLSAMAALVSLAMLAWHYDLVRPKDFFSHEMHLSDNTMRLQISTGAPTYREVDACSVQFSEYVYDGDPPLPRDVVQWEAEHGGRELVHAARPPLPRLQYPEFVEWVESSSYVGWRNMTECRYGAPCCRHPAPCTDTVENFSRVERSGPNQVVLFANCTGQNVNVTVTTHPELLSDRRVLRRSSTAALREEYARNRAPKRRTVAFSTDEERTSLAVHGMDLSSWISDSEFVLVGCERDAHVQDLDGQSTSVSGRTGRLSKSLTHGHKHHHHGHHHKHHHNRDSWRKWSDNHGRRDTRTGNVQDDHDMADGREYVENLHTIVRAKNRQWGSAKEIHDECARDKYSVLLLMLDNTSRLAFQRRMPRTSTWLCRHRVNAWDHMEDTQLRACTERSARCAADAETAEEKRKRRGNSHQGAHSGSANQSATTGRCSGVFSVWDFQRYTTVGEGTPPNLTPMLRKHGIDEWGGDARYWWDGAEKRGYLTAWIMEECTDYFQKYWRDYPMPQMVHDVIEPFCHKSYGRVSWGNRCVLQNNAAQLTFDLLKSVFELYGTEEVGLLINGLILDGHDDNCYARTIEVVDDALAQFLEFLEHAGHLERTAVLIVSDHGAWKGPYFHTRGGMIEHAMPVFKFILPMRLLHDHPHLIDTLSHNEGALFSSYVIYNTLVRLKEGDFEPRQAHHVRPIDLSVFDHIPVHISCADMRIPNEYCFCRIPAGALDHVLVVFPAVALFILVIVGASILALLYSIASDGAFTVRFPISTRS